MGGALLRASRHLSAGLGALVPRRILVELGEQLEREIALKR